MKRKDPSGFTLVELLIVLAVIALLTALLFPGLARTREKARQASCLSNLHQIALASELYTQEYDDTFLWNPPGGGARGEIAAAEVARMTGRARACADRPCTSWAELLQPYVRSWSVLHCPSFPAGASFMGWLDPPASPGAGYGLNGVLLGDECEPRSVASLRHPASQVAIVGDSATPWSGIWVERAPASPWPTGWSDAVSLSELDEWPSSLPLASTLTWSWQVSQDQTPGWGPELHGGGSNFAFADGHAQFLRPSARVISLNPPSVRTTATVGRAGTDRAGSFPGALLD